jgi:hypothetical protein
MAGTKKLTYIGADSGKTLYAIIMRQRDNAYLDSDFKFRETPTAPAQAFTEKTLAAMLTKNYLWSNSTYAWEDGHYTVAIYDQAGGVPAFNTDTLIASATLFVLDDEIKEPAYSVGG